MAEQVVVKRVQSIEDARVAFCCLEEVPTPWEASLSLCRNWIAENLGRHVEGYHLLVEDEVIGQLYYAPSERALVPYEIEPGIAVMYCEWVQRRHQKQGWGRRLFAAFEEQMRSQGCKGILVEATARETQMHYRHYLGRGFSLIHDAGERKLLYLPLAQSVVSARPLTPNIQPRSGVPVEILILTGYLCPCELSTHLLMGQVAHEFGDRVTLRRELLTPETVRSYGVAGGIFINGRRKLTGIPPEEAVRQAILEEL